MPRLFVIEPSATLCNLLTRTLHAGGFRAIESAHDYTDATRRLHAESFDAVIIGIPPRGYVSAARIALKAMLSEEHSRTPLIVLVHKTESALVHLIDQRGFSEIIPWQRFPRIPGLLAGLLPYDDPTEEPAAMTAPRRGLRILFVDDSQSARYAYRQLLDTHGFDVDLADSAEAAIEAAGKRAYDFIVVDYYLPDGTGAGVLRELKKSGITSQLAIITGSYRETVIKECLDAGATECMFKDEAKELFLARIESIARIVEARKAVDDERHRLHSILGSVGDGVYGVDSHGVITFINQTGVSMLGYQSTEQLVGAAASERIHGNEPADVEIEKDILESYRSGRKLNGIETVFRRRKHRPIPVECTVFPWSVRGEVEGAVVVFRDISERKTVEQLRWEITHDMITGLVNRRQFLHTLEDRLGELRQDKGYGALLLIDIDGYSRVVEDLGEADAERLLAEVAARLRQRLREDDVLARLPGDRFALLLAGIQLTNVYAVTDSFRSLLKEITYRKGNQQRTVSGSVGVVILSEASTSAEQALDHASSACQMAKRKGKNHTHIYIAEEDTYTSQQLEQGWTERFKDALRDNRFIFLAQPILRTSSVTETFDSGQWETAIDGDGSIMFELLLRMVSADGQRLSPSVFIPLAERINMVQEIDFWVICNALRLLKSFDRSGVHASLTINLSNVTLQDHGAISRIAEELSGHLSYLPRIIFEVTETAEIASVHQARKSMMQLRKLGCRFALDDFGTGFSSFAHLKNLPVDFIKIDGMFVQQVTSNSIDQTMVRSICTMAKDLGLKTIAEHVGSQATMRSVMQCGVDYLQGHFLGQPREISEHLAQISGNSADSENKGS